jgi:uncharacterized membrane protein YhaH (DUF805 family)
MGSFPAAILMGFMNYAKFSGFASRAEYWYWYLFTLLGSIVAIVLDELVFKGASTSDGTRYTYDSSGANYATAYHYVNFQPSIFTLIFALVTLLPSIAITVRRLHDAGYSGLSYFWSFVPIAGPFILLYRLVQPSQHLARDTYGYGQS